MEHSDCLVHGDYVGEEILALGGQDPAFDSLRGDRRFSEMLAGMNYPK
jgi:hypothetical protein